MIRSLPTLTALLLSACTVASTSSSEASESATGSLRIAAWNIEHLAAEPGLGCEPRDAADYQIVADVIDQVDADIWLLQEIESEAALARVFDAGEWTFHVEDRPDTGSGPPCRGREDGLRLHMQRTAVVIRSDIEHVRGDDLAALDVGGRGFLRHGVNITVNFKGSPVDLMSMHLKSGCFTCDAAGACPTLFDQAPVLEAWLDERSAAGRAVIVGGDFNRRLAMDNDFVWVDVDGGNSVHLIIVGEGTSPQYDPRYSESIGRII